MAFGVFMNGDDDNGSAVGSSSMSLSGFVDTSDADNDSKDKKHKGKAFVNFVRHPRKPLPDTGRQVEFFCRI